MAHYLEILSLINPDKLLIFLYILCTYFIGCTFGKLDYLLNSDCQL